MHEWDAVNEEEHCKCSGISSKINKHILSTGDILKRMDENVCECEYVYVRIWEYVTLALYTVEF